MSKSAQLNVILREFAQEVLDKREINTHKCRVKIEALFAQQPQPPVPDEFNTEEFRNAIMPHYEHFQY